MFSNALFWIGGYFKLNIYNFLQQCVDNEWELDIEDIKHILAQDFDYVIKANSIAHTYENADEMTKELTEELLKKK